MTRYKRKLDRLREIAALDVGLAAAAASSIGGPAGLANHLLRCIPPTPDAIAFWESVDDAWLDTWCDILRLAPDDRAAPIRDIVRDRLFLRHSNLALQQFSAAHCAELRYAEGVADAAPHLAAIVERAGLSLDREIWGALGVLEWRTALHSSDSELWTPLVLRRAAMLRKAHCEARIRARDDERLAALRLANPSYADATYGTDGAPNLYVAWLRLHRSDGTVRMPARDGIIALRRLFRLPLSGGSTAIAPPRSCLRCGAAAKPIEPGTSVVARPRAGVDGFGEHALTCLRSGGETQRRHNEIAYAIRDCIAAAGWRPSCASGAVFEAHRGRPADIWVDCHPLHNAGLAIDCTAVTAAGHVPGSAAGIAEAAKVRKYAAEVARNPGLGFQPFAVDLHGNIGPAAWHQMQAWARAIASAADSSRTQPEALDWVVGTIARAFVSGCVRQIRTFEERQSGSACAPAHAPSGVSVPSRRTAAAAPQTPTSATAAQGTGVETFPQQPERDDGSSSPTQQH
jgi:hypothetical protein